MKKKNNKTSDRLKKTGLMKELPGEKKYNGISKINRFNILFVSLQMIFVIFTIICLIWSLFNNKVYDILQFVMAATLFICGYNYKVVYGKPQVSYIFYIVGMIILVVEILALILGV